MRPLQQGHEARARNRLYRLFLAEFAAVQLRERDATLRRRLESATNATDFDSPRALTELKRRYARILGAPPRDLAVVLEALGAEAAAPRPSAARLVASLRETRFDFDARILLRLGGLGSHAPRSLSAPSSHRHTTHPTMSLVIPGMSPCAAKTGCAGLSFSR